MVSGVGNFWEGDVGFLREKRMSCGVILGWFWLWNGGFGVLEFWVDLGKELGEICWIVGGLDCSGKEEGEELQNSEEEGGGLLSGCSLPL